MNTGILDGYTDITPTFDIRPATTQLARHTSRVFRQMIQEIGPISEAIDAIPIKETKDGVLTAFTLALDSPRDVCLASLLALLSDSPNDGRIVNRGNFAVRIDGRMLVAAWDYEHTRYDRQGDPIRPSGSYRLWDIDASAVIDLTFESESSASPSNRACRTR